MIAAKKYLPALIMGLSISVCALVLIQRPQATLSHDNQKRISVSLLPVQSSDYEPKAQYYGYVESAKVQTLTAKVDGEITKLHDAFIPGALINKDEIVYELDKQDYIDSLAQLKSNLTIESANLELELGLQQLAKNNLAQFKQASSINVQGQSTPLMLRQPQLTIAHAKKEHAQLALAKVSRDIEKATLIASEDLIVTKQWVLEGDYVSVGQAIGEVAYLDTIWLKVAVSSEVAKHLTIGGKANIHLPSSKRGVTSVITHIDNAIDQANQRVNVYVAMSRYKNQVKLNEFVHVELVLPLLEQVYAVPAQLIQDGKMWALGDDFLLAQIPVDVMWQHQNMTWISANVDPSLRLLAHRLPIQLEGQQATVTSIQL